MTETAYQTINVAPVAGAIGAEISDIDLSEPLGNQVYQEIHDALMTHQVIFFRDQNITPEEHVAFGRHFGELNIHPFAKPLDGHPEVLVIENDEERPSIINYWHTDVTFLEKPPMGSILLAREAPESGGDTMWSSMYAAYSALSDKMQAFLSGLTAIHDYEHVFGSQGRLRTNRVTDEKTEQELQNARKRLPPAEHPVVRTHPVTGRKGIFVNSGFTVRIKDMRPAESDALLEFLYRHIATPEFQCRFRWRRNSIAFWDNRCTQHYPISDYWPSHRQMHRVTINGDRPV